MVRCAEAKGIFDPHNLMNPGKDADTGPSPTDRCGRNYHTIELKTVFDWGVDGGYAPAIEMCNGAGVLSRVGAGTMCPSYMSKHAMNMTPPTPVPMPCATPWPVASHGRTLLDRDVRGDGSLPGL